MKKIYGIIVIGFILLSLALSHGCGSSRGDTSPVIVTGRAQGRIYITNSLDNSVDVFDARNNARIAGSPFETGEFPAGMALDSSRERLYVANYIGRSITVFNTDNMTQISGSPFTMEYGPYGIYVDGTGRIFVVCPDANRLYVLDPDTMQSVTGSPLETGQAPYAVTGLPSKNQVVVANSASGNFHVFNADTLLQVDGSPFTTTTGAFGMTVDNDRGRLFITGADVRIYNYSNFTQVAGSPLNTRGSSNKGVAIKPGYDRLWVAVSDEGQISLFNTTDMEEVVDSPFYIGGAPEGIAINAEDDLLYVTDTSGSAVRIFSTNLMEASDSPLTTGKGPRQILLDPAYYGN